MFSGSRWVAPRQTATTIMETSRPTTTTAIATRAEVEETITITPTKAAAAAAPVHTIAPPAARESSMRAARKAPNTTPRSTQPPLQRKTRNPKRTMNRSITSAGATRINNDRRRGSWRIGGRSNSSSSNNNNKKTDIRPRTFIEWARRKDTFFVSSQAAFSYSRGWTAVVFCGRARVFMISIYILITVSWNWQWSFFFLLFSTNGIDSCCRFWCSMSRATLLYHPSLRAFCPEQPTNYLIVC